jgi:hypothetical protein
VVELKEPIPKEVDIGHSGIVKLKVLADRKRLLLAFEKAADGLVKAGVNALADALKQNRERMDR